MSTIPKEILQKFDNEAAKECDTFKEEEKYTDGAIFGYQLATDGREELEKECNQLNAFSIAQTEVITALQSQCTEKDQEIERLKEQYSIMDGRRERAIKSLEESEKQFGEQQQEIERLKELIEHEYRVTLMAHYMQNPVLTLEKCEEKTEQKWQQFKTENNL